MRPITRTPQRQLQAATVLVTGGTGFVGANLVRRLIQEGGRPHLLVRPAANWWRLEDVREQLEPHTVDVLDFDQLCGVVREIRPELIYHLATYGAYASQTDADQVIRTDILGTWNLLRACGASPYRLFVNTGSSSEYGWKSQAMRETDLLEPNSYYAVAKSAQTLLCQHVARSEQRPINTFRLFSVYGPYEEPSRLFPTIIQRSLRGEALEMVSPQTARDFVYIDDVVDAYLQIDRLAAHVGETFNIGTGVQSTLRDVVDAVQQAVGAEVPVRWGTMPSRIWDTDTWVADGTKARRLLQWSPSTRLEEGVRRMVGWHRCRLTAPLPPRRVRRPSKALV